MSIMPFGYCLSRIMTEEDGVREKKTNRQSICDDDMQATPLKKFLHVTFFF